MARTTDWGYAAVLSSPLFFAVAAALIPIVTASTEPDDDFYNAAAQIIPVLLIALIVEAELADLWSSPTGRTYGTLIVLALLVGELSALLEAGDILGGKASLSVTGAGLVGGFVAVAAVAVVSKWFGTEHATRPSPQSRPAPDRPTAEHPPS